MIRLTRLPRPGILERKQEEWTKKFLESGEARPDSSKYRHREIVRTLMATSHDKCFYCEQAVAEREGEVDHYREVALQRDLAYEWTNLCWSCRDCNDKLPERTIPCTDCLYPFDANIDPEDHLRYESEKIFSREDSVRGSKTIDKYRLARGDLDLARCRALRVLDRALQDLHRAGFPFDSPEVSEILSAFTGRDRPFSAMLRQEIARIRRVTSPRSSTPDRA